MAAVQELLIDRLVTAPTISGGELGGDDETVMVLLFLAGGGLVTVETVDAFPGVRAHLVFVDHGILGSRMTFGAFSGGANEICAGLLGLDLWPCPIEEECREN